MTCAKKICRLCLEPISKEFEVINTCKEGMLKIISLDLNVNLTDNPIICPKCEEVLQQTFFFKTTCLGNDDYLKTFRHSDTSIKLNLEEIVQRNFVADGIKCEDERACRFCFRFFDSESFAKLDDIGDDIFLRDMLSKCLPEIKLEITNRPVMCFECMENLQNQFNFVISCLDNDEKIKGYMQTRGTDNNNHVDLNEVLKSLNAIRERDKNAQTIFGFVKQENIDTDLVDNCDIEKIIEGCEVVIEDDSNIMIEENQASDEDSDRFEDILRSSTTPHNSEKIFTCPICPHKTNRNGSLKLHLLVHKTLPKKDLYSCDECSFTSKWRPSLSQHIKIHRNTGSSFKCAHCTYESKYKKHLRRHLRKHGKVVSKPFECQYCSFKCSDKWYLKVHIKNKHKIVVRDAKQTFSCDLCNFDTHYKTQLDSHKKSAHNVVKYVCDCGYGTQRLDRFKEHMRRHMDVEEVEMFGCELCDFKSKYKNSLRHHMTIHDSGKVIQKRKPKLKPNKTNGKSLKKVDVKKFIVLNG